MAEATAKLSATTHKPFSSISRFESVGNEPKSLQQRGAQSNAIRKLPAPTVMKLGLLRGGGRKKGTTSFMALRAHRGKAPAATSRTERSIRENNACDAELLKIFSQFEEDMEGESELVEKKLLQALHLSEARTLGLPKRIISLSSYEQSGGSTFVAKELVRLSPSKRVPIRKKNILLVKSYHFANVPTLLSIKFSWSTRKSFANTTTTTPTPF